MADLEYPCGTTMNTYKNELIATAKKICTPGCGILAADESTGTIGKRFDAIQLENNHANRIAYRRLLFTTPGLEESISGTILYEETLFDIDPLTNEPLVKPLQEKGIVLGIKVDQGTKALNDDGETWTDGLNGLAERCQKYYQAGARFAKWRAVLRIDTTKNMPSKNAIVENAIGLAKYAKICQMNGLVPIVEPEILMDGTHTIGISQYYAEQVLAECYYQLHQHNVIIEGTLLKPAMVTPGQDSGYVASPTEIATHTLLAFQRTIPAGMPGVVHLSGGLSEEQATLNLNALNVGKTCIHPWAITFSYGRALQQSCIATWGGKDENIVAAQNVLLQRANANGVASLGKYDGSAASEASTQSLYVKDYKY